MQRSPKTVAAFACSVALVTGTGVVAATAVLDLQSPGISGGNGAVASAPAVTAPASTVPAEPTSQPPAAQAPSPAPGAPLGRPQVVAVVAPAPNPFPSPLAAPAAAPAPALAPAPLPTTPPPIPPAPAGCKEAEWDREHQYWKCHVDEREEKDD
jgi:hypothetical protein